MGEVSLLYLHAALAIGSDGTENSLYTPAFISILRFYTRFRTVAHDSTDAPTAALLPEMLVVISVRAVWPKPLAVRARTEIR